MRPHDCRVDHQPFQIGFARQRDEDVVQNAHLDPAVIAALYGFVVAQSLRQIAPAPARAGHPQQGVQKPSIVGARTPLALPAARRKLLKPLPLVVPQRIDIPNHQADLQNQP